MIAKKIRIAFLVLLVAAAGLWACNKDSDSSIPDTTSYVNVFVFNPDASYDAVLDTATLGSGLKLGENTGYKGFLAKRYKLCIFAAGDRTDTLIQGQISLRNNHHYSVFFMKNRNNVLQVLATEDPFGPASKTDGYVRVINLSDSYNRNSSPLLMNYFVDGVKEKEFTNIGYGAVSVFKKFAYGPHRRDVRNASTDSTLFYNPADTTFTVDVGKSYSWISYGPVANKDSFHVVTFQHN